MKRFSLSVLLRVVLLVGAVIGLYVDREPWAWDGQSYTRPQFDQIAPEGWAGRPQTNQSPDGTLGFTIRHYYEKPIPVYGIKDPKTDELLFRFDGTGKRLVGFLDNDTLVLSEKELGPVGENYFLLRRRFPEQWWGIFHRPLFWVAVITMLSFAWDLLRKTRSVPAQ